MVEQGGQSAVDGLRVGVNVMWLQPGRVGGTEQYIRRVLTSATEELDPAPSFRLFGTDSAFEAVAPAGAEHRPVDVSSSKIRRVVQERTSLRSEISLGLEHGLDLLHHPGGTVPFESSLPTVVTIHDLQPLANPDNFGRVKAEYLARAIPEAIRRAHVVTTPSHWVASDIVNRFDVDADRVVVVSAFADMIDPSLNHEPSAAVKRILARGPVLLFPAMTMAHKNHRFLFDAFADARRIDPDIQLVCVGPAGRDHGELVDYARQVSPHIHLLGHIPRPDLDAFYVRSEALVFPSMYEGFGLPILEAQSAGLPVIASNTTAIPEVAGEGAILLAPDDHDSWVAALSQRPSGEARAQLVAKGRENMARFGPKSTAQALSAAYLQARS